MVTEKVSYKVITDERKPTRASETNINLETSFVGVRYESTMEDKAFLHRCFSGQLKRNYSWIDVDHEIQEACEDNLLVNFGGGDIVLIQPRADKKISEDHLRKLSKWFEYLEQWNENDVHNIRFVLTHWVGVPMHVRCTRGTTTRLVHYDYKIWQMNVKITLLNGTLIVSVYDSTKRFHIQDKL